MIEGWSLTSPLPVWATILLLVIALTVACTFEWIRNSRWLLIRMIAAVVSVLALFGMLLQPSHISSSTNMTVLIAGDHDERIVDSLHQLHDELKVISMPGVKANSTTKLKSLQELSDHAHQIGIVIGNGLSPSARDIMGDKKFQFTHNKALPEGILDLQLPDNVYVNEETEIVGIYHSRTDSAWIKLEGPEGVIDSVKMDRGEKTFAFAFTPKITGNTRYLLRVKDESYDVPLIVKEKKKLNILLIQQYPTFETRQLKETLSKRHGVLVRYELSQKIFRFENYNIQRNEFKRINGDLLNDFDLLITDTDALQSLSSGEWKAMEDQITKGLGMLVLIHESPGKNATLQARIPLNVKSSAADTVSLVIRSKSFILNIFPGSLFGEEASPLIQTKGKQVALYKQIGFGKFGASLIQDSYKIALLGDSLAYEQLWSTQIEKLSRQETTTSSVRVLSPFPVYVDEPVELEVISTQIQPKLFFDSTRLPLREHSQVDGLFKAKVWFNKIGWNTLTTSDSAVAHVFVSNRGASKSIRDYQDVLQTRLLAHEHSSSASSEPTSSAVNPAIFYILFLVAAGTLWLLPKL
jgi:hypothetical protein